MEAIYEGKAKRLFATDHPHELLMEFKNDATAFDGKKKAEFEEKGLLNTAISLLIFELLGKRGIEHHLVRSVDETRVIVKKVEILLVEVIVRNVAAGGFSRKYGVEEGRPFSAPTVEFSYKSDELGDPLLNDDHIRELGLATAEDLAFLREAALRVNEILSELFAKAGLRLVDFKLEFGRLAEDPSRMVLADEISPDGCRLWDLETNEKMDKDRFRRDLGGVMESYREVLRRLQTVLKDGTAS
ncbi:MAG: phosphoribosylaminoimidazolesuccinocarboxamide synthase [Verrucomicrobiota bacterium]